MKSQSARAVIFSKDDIESIYLIYRRKNGKEYYVLPGGGIEENETILEALDREILEETGITLKNVEKLAILDNEDYASHISHIFKGVEVLKGKPTGEEMKNTNPDNYYELQVHKISKIQDLDLKPSTLKDLIKDVCYMLV
ncbi:MAG: NUDIX domain-containing protein [Proteobacteria bacterium]|nr:NUDIX domain-containing protein [Pseudomonadota bacterium]